METSEIIWSVLAAFAVGVIAACLLIRIVKKPKVLSGLGFILTISGLFSINYIQDDPKVVSIAPAVVLTSLGFTLWFFWMVGISEKIINLKSMNSTNSVFSPPEPAAVPLPSTLPNAPSPRPRALIEFSGITKVYKNSSQEDTVALKSVNLQIDKGELVAIMGSSGSGKSTLMHILGLLDVPTSGEYFLEGVDVGKLNSRQQAIVRNAAIGFVFQQFNLLPRATVLENVLLPTIYGSEKVDRERALKIIDLVGLSDRIKHKSNQLSGGQIQRVAIARALMMNPRIILADEPTGNLDSKTSEEIMRLFEDINLAGTTIVLVTHEEDIARHAGRIIKLRDGEVMFDSKFQTNLENLSL